MFRPKLRHLFCVGAGSYVQISPSDDTCLCPKDHFRIIGVARNISDCDIRRECWPKTFDLFTIGVTILSLPTRYARAVRALDIDSSKR